ncbi:UDP-N-acetylmuramoyl-L-alanyl-D-glutamate--L-lysine ligase [Vagococcus sp. PNs007]|uniref:UDP-N-acetylmuramyl-tripeptide synthetase n=1 Tax=Vagococcus proximus TaxID=2991417 RepID=A0ABT5X1W0_9ENTE|nr:UDP-N-acetylmuramoyl-L-alanyl-D-glutamate--L-lysine ligase [Vagococcus proximus]MDF0479977.1 UDP-N-acetylmuramoyl-L-alanyl-D-glutamate--L-lysine ligase [Vagococcus proximus]
MITLAKIANLLKENQLVREFIIDNEWHYAISEDVAESTISHITYDSRAIKEGSLFFCKGLAFKSDYLEQAIADGAGFYVTEVNYEIQSDAVGIIVTDIKKAMALISMAFYDFPQDELKVIAYTGTKGKTTAAYFCKYILEKATNQKTALLSTMETILDGKTSIKSLLTTPESVDLYRMMREAVSNGMSHLVMEVSSQAYKTDRVYGLNFDVGIFLNISEDHIGTIEHPDFDDYFYCKRQLLKHSKQVILNKNSDFYAILEDVAKESTDKVITYGDDSVEADYTFIPSSEGKGKFEVVAKEDKLAIAGDYAINLLGDFNQGNALSAMMATALVGAKKEAMSEGLSLAKVPGRMDSCVTNKGVPVYVDFAHNLLSLHTLLSFVKKEHPESKLVVLIGSTGGKGVSRRHDFGNVLSELADIAVLTSDDPGHEKAEDIIAEIQETMTDTVRCEIEVDREKAIELALNLAGENDVVVLAGKGSDKYQVIGDERTPYEGDLEIANKLIEGGY